MVKKTLYLLTTLLIFLSACGTRTETAQKNKTLAEKYFRGLYSCDSSVVDELCADDIAVSYPVFRQLFNTPALRGKDEVRHFSNHFCKRWTDGRITIHEKIADSNTVVLVWSFQARYNGPVSPGSTPGETELSWGGITLIRFDEAGKIEAEIGEESDPGPFSRMQLH